MSLLMNGPCAACGHTGQDHAEGYVGATVQDKAYCHVDDHTCYTPASRAMTLRRRPVALLPEDPA